MRSQSMLHNRQSVDDEHNISGFCNNRPSNPNHAHFVEPPQVPPRTRIGGSYRSRAPSPGPGPSHLKPVVMPDKFDGNGVWEDYMAHFDICAKINGWDSDQKANFLAVSLRGMALMLLGDLPMITLSNYDALLHEIQTRFGQEGKSELFRTQLKNRIKRQDENFQELGQEVKRSTARAYPEAPSTLRDTLAKCHFIDALTDTDISHKYHSKPRSLTESVHLATEWQAFKQAETHRRGVITEGGQSRYVRATEITPAKGEETLMENFFKQMSEMQTELHELRSHHRGSNQGGERKYNSQKETLPTTF